MSKNSWKSLFMGCYGAPDHGRSEQGSEQSKPEAAPALPMFSTDDLSLTLAGSNLHSFTLKELKAATRNFSTSNIIGKGGFGAVYKGSVGDNLRPGLAAQAVAVKSLDQDGTQGHREWLAEVVFLGQLRHPHLVKLIGYCCEDEQRMLAYEFMPCGSLEDHLFGKFRDTMPWLTRLKIAVGAAKGLAFLHESEKPVIYRDFKASNVLLDSDYTAKLSDFGLAKDGPQGDVSHVTTRVMGTHGYAAPEYILTGHLTAKSDVYSFGVVLLELLTGKKSVDKTRRAREQSLVDWARNYLRKPEKLHLIMDPRLEFQCSAKGAEKAALLAHQCLSSSPKKRPRMREVVEALEGLLELDDDAAIGPFVFIASAEEEKKDDTQKTEKKQHNNYRSKNRLRVSVVHAEDTLRRLERHRIWQN